MSKKYEERDTTKRTHMIGAKLSDDEYERFLYICKELNITQAEYIRDAVLTAKISRPVVHSALDKDSAKTLIAHFGKIGSNLNQIARALNQGAVAETGLLLEIKNSITELYKGINVLTAVGGAG